MGKVNFEAYALEWVDERGLAATTDELYRRLLRLHVLPGFGDLDLDEIAPSTVRTWRAERLAATGATTVAKSYRLLKAIMETAIDDELIRRNPCRIRGAGSEQAKERSTATVAQVDALAEAMGPRWRLMVYFCAYGPMRPEEQVALRRTSVTLDPLAVRITEAAPELNTGRRVEGDTKSAAGVRTIHLPAFLSMEVKRHLDWFAEKEPDGLLFVGEKGAPFRRTSFGRKWAKARAKVGLSKDFRFYDLRHTGHTLSTQSGATLKDTMGTRTAAAALVDGPSAAVPCREETGAQTHLHASRKAFRSAGSADLWSACRTRQAVSSRSRSHSSPMTCVLRSGRWSDSASAWPITSPAATRWGGVISSTAERI